MLEGLPLTRKTSRSCLFSLSLLLVIALTEGCGKKEHPLVPLKGVVNIDGKPAGNILVQFMPDVMSKSEGPTSYGVSDANGKFELSTYDGKTGVALGTHIVILVDKDEERPAQGEPLTKPPRLNSKFSTAAGGIKVVVVEGKDVKLDATSN